MKSKKSATAPKATGNTGFYQSKVGEAIQAIEEQMATGEFQLRWNAHPQNFVGKNRYKGVNLLLLARAAMIDPERKASKYWLSFKQASEKGLKIEKGQKATAIIVWVQSKGKTDEEKEKITKGLIRPRLYPITHNVFNLAQTEGYQPEGEETKTHTFFEQYDRLKTMMDKTGVTFSNSGNSAYYMPSKHHINLPNFADFVGETQEEREMLYLTTLTHELAHSTMKKLRKDHFDDSMNRISLHGDVEYAKEEVIAELCSAMLCGTLGIQKQTLSSHAGYIRGWLDKAKQASPMFFTTACSKAAKAHDYLMSQIDPSYQVPSKDEEECEAVAEMAEVV